MPVFVIGLLAGAVADRFDRRRLLVVTQDGSALTSLGLGFVVVTGQLEAGTSTPSASSTARCTFEAPARRSMLTKLSPACSCRTRQS
jgi:MFS family permease